jgi:pimeloyl-ACP methyl ester carboxylesterase
MPIQCRQVRVDKLKSSRLCLAILVAAFAARTVSAQYGFAAAATATAAQALFAASPCPALPALANARCGYLVVPEDRAQPTGHTIRLLVAIIPARSARAKSDPVVYLAGGPGGIAMAEAPILIEAGINRDRDLILMDQRGTLYSEPALTCPDMDQFFVRSIGIPLDAPSTGLLHSAAARACYLRSVATGNDISAYNTSESAADFAVLRTALGITQWNVFGVSYGTNLALTLMREHPEGIRSVVIDSVEPPSVVNVGRFWGNASEGFDNLFRACAEQPNCWTRQPGFAETFTALVRKLESNPVTTSVTEVVGQPPTKVVIDGGALVNWLANMSFATEDYPHVPAWIGELADGHAENIALSIAKPVLATPAGYIGYGLTYGVICSEWVPYESESDVLLQGRLAFPDYPDSVLAPAVHFSYVYADCRNWNVRQGPPAQRAVTRSTIPTLILSGGFDASHRRVGGKSRPERFPTPPTWSSPGSDISQPPCLDARGE